MKQCPECGKDVDNWLTRDGVVRNHRRPVTIPGGVASATYPGSGAVPEEAAVPAWNREAFSRPGF